MYESMLDSVIQLWEICPFVRRNNQPTIMSFYLPFNPLEWVRNGSRWVGWSLRVVSPITSIIIPSSRKWLKYWSKPPLVRDYSVVVASVTSITHPPHCSRLSRSSSSTCAPTTFASFTADRWLTEIVTTTKTNEVKKNPKWHGEECWACYMCSDLQGNQGLRNQREKNCLIFCSFRHNWASEINVPAYKEKEKEKSELHEMHN